MMKSIFQVVQVFSYLAVELVSNFRINWTKIGYSSHSVKLRSAKEGATLVPAAERRSDCGGRKDQLRRIRERPKTQVGCEGPAFKGNFVTLK